MADELKDIREAYDYDLNAWEDIRREAQKDMRFVGGDPWEKADKDARKDRPIVAPEELSQYRNQVINALMANPRGAKFAPTGNGANDKGAQFYASKWREIEYRSHATNAYLTAADNALQRSYGFIRITVGYASPHSVNQEISIEGFQNPDMVLPDSDALRLDSSDMKRCFVYQWMSQADFKREYGKKAKLTSFGEFQSQFPHWIQGNKVLLAEHWSIKTRKRQLLLVQPAAPTQPPRQLVPAVATVAPVQMFKDEYQAGQGTVLRELREVDYPDVWMQLVNGVEILHEQRWAGKYIPIVSCYGKVLYMDGDAGLKKVMLSLTRFGRDPWKAYCYACSQELEILGQVPKASVLAAAGQLAGFEKDWEESPYVPKAWLLYHAKTAATGETVLPPPQRLAYMQGDNLQAIEIVKEGFRRAIQAAMGSNFLPTQAQQRNEKSGVALDKIDQVASQGTYHFVYAYDSMIRRAGIIGEDLIDRIHDYRGETGVMAADGKASIVQINNPDQQDAVTTAGDYLVTVSTAPSSDSEREAAAEFTETLVGNLQMVAQIAGPKAAAKVLAQAIRMRNLGPRGDQLADILDPPAPDGQKPPSPELQAAQQQIEQLTSLLHQAAQEKQAKVVEQQGKFEIVKYQTDAKSQDAAADREVKLVVAELSAKVDRMALLLEASQVVGVRLEASAARTHDAAQAGHERAHDSIERAKDRLHDRISGAVEHAQALDAADQAHQQALEQGDAATQGQMAVQAAAPQPEAGA